MAAQTDETVADDLDRIVDRLRDEVLVPLPTLTRDELVALGDRPVLADAADALWWERLEHAARLEVTAAAQRGLLVRGLLDFEDDPNRLAVADEVRLVLAVRAAPAHVLVAGHPDQPNNRTVRGYGIQRTAGDTALLLESRLVPGVAEFALARPQSAAEAIARFLLQPPAEPDTVVRRRLEWMSPAGPDREAAAERRILLVGSGSAAIVPVDADGAAGEPARTDEDQLTTLLGSLMARG